MSEQVPKIDDSLWEVKLKDLNPNAKKSVELLVIIKRKWYDDHKREHYSYFLQKVQVYIPDTPEFYPLFLSVSPFQPFGWRKLGKKEQKLIFHNLLEGSTQSIGLDKQSLAFSHVRIRLVDSEKSVSVEEAQKLVRAGQIYKVVPETIEQNYSEEWV